MCGITGHLHRGVAADRATIDAQLACLTHRGPDSVGSFVAGNAAVGQTRLAVIDLETGDPPITTPDGRIGVALNGEIYNFHVLRQGLLDGGHQLRTSGDTEVIAHLAEELPATEVARALTGMFAFAVWDSLKGELTLGRDRLGKKPLYYWHDDQAFVFGSEIKALLTHPAVPDRLDRSAIPGFLTYGYVATPRTFYEGICSVPPGHVLVVDRDLRPTLQEYWRPPVPGLDGFAYLDLDERDAVQEVRRRLQEAVARRLVSDVPLGAFLSGGVDSSAIVALMADSGASPVRTFTIGFDDRDGFDERAPARTVARHIGTDHTELVVHPDAVDLVEKLVWHHDQPFGDSSAIPTYLLSELTREHVTVAMCGDGGDELFGGYDRFAGGLLSARLARLPGTIRAGAGGTLRQAARLTGSKRLERARRFAETADLGLPLSYRSWLALVNDPWRIDLVGSSWDRSDDAWTAAWDASAGAHDLDRLLHLNLRTYLLDDLLPKVDRMSMAHGLEVRSPFLDHDLVEFASLLPPRCKVRGRTTKWILKEAMADRLPAEILHRPKRGFAVPLDRWFREDLAGYTSSMLGAEGARVREHVDGEALDRLLAEHQREISHGHALWALLTLEIFLRMRGW